MEWNKQTVKSLCMRLHTLGAAYDKERVIKH